MNFPILLPNIFNYPFTYKSDQKLNVGDFVEVPFGKTKIIGVVWNEFEKEKFKKFKVKKILNKIEIPSLKKSTINFLFILFISSREFFCSTFNSNEFFFNLKEKSL